MTPQAWWFVTLILILVIIALVRESSAHACTLKAHKPERIYNIAYPNWMRGEVEASAICARCGTLYQIREPLGPVQIAWLREQEAKLRRERKCP